MERGEEDVLRMSGLQVNSGKHQTSNSNIPNNIVTGGGGGGGGGGKTEVKRNSHVSLVSGGKEDSAMQNSKLSID